MMFYALCIFSFNCAPALAQTETLSNAQAVDQDEQKSTLKNQRQSDFLAAKRIVFLGDSNTHNGHYISLIESTLLASHETVPELVNLGLSSETCSGLSEPIHPFPRPDVHERLDRMFDKARPDIVFVCYGMNDAIYAPLDESRFEKFKSGMSRMVEQAKQHNVKLVLMTPPPFDAFALHGTDRLVPLDAKEFSWTHVYKNYEEEVISKYAKWMVDEWSGNESVYAVVDTHSFILKFIAEKRAKDSEYSFSGDGVHFDMDGHRAMAKAILGEFGFDQTLVERKEFLDLIAKRQQLTHLAWLSHVGHLRPKVAPGVPFDELGEKVAPISEQIDSSEMRQR